MLSLILQHRAELSKLIFHPTVELDSWPKVNYFRYDQIIEFYKYVSAAG